MWPLADMSASQRRRGYHHCLCGMQRKESCRWGRSVRGRRWRARVAASLLRLVDRRLISEIEARQAGKLFGQWWLRHASTACSCYSTCCCCCCTCAAWRNRAQFTWCLIYRRPRPIWRLLITNVIIIFITAMQ